MTSASPGADADPEPLAGPPGRAVLRRGLGVLGVAIREQPRVFAAAVLGSAVYGATTVGQAALVGQVVQRVVVPAFATGRTTRGLVAGAAVAIVALAVLKATGIAGRRLLAGVMQYRLQASYRRRVTRQYLRLPLSWHSRHPTGVLLSNANADVEATWQVIAPLPMAVGVLVMLSVAGVAMLATDVLLALVGFLVFPVIFGLNFGYQRRLSPLATRAQQLRAQVSEVAHESFDGALVVKSLGRESGETQRFRAVSEQLRDTQISLGRVRGLFDPAMEALPSLGVLAVLLLGSSRVAAGRLATGDLVQVAYLFTLLALPIRALGWVLGELPRSVVGWDRLRSVLDAGGALSYGASVLPPAGPARLELRGVSVRHGQTEVLHAVHLTAGPGGTLALVGPTGAGKSTLVALLGRLTDPDAGRVLLDGIDLRELRAGSTAAAVAVVPQQSFLFDDTIRANVTLGADVDDARVWEVLRLAQADGFVSALADGLNTRVGERGTSLSGGQRQRIAIARALIRSPRLLVLDDATSAVDPRVEADLLAALREARLEATVVVVAHRRATISLADQVVYLEQGQVVARGTHGQLLAGCPGYARLLTAYDRASAKPGTSEAVPA